MLRRTLVSLFAAVNVCVAVPITAIAAPQDAVSVGYEQLAKHLVADYDDQIKSAQPSTRSQSRFVNDMEMKQKQNWAYIEAQAHQAKRSGERLYSLDEILQLKAGDLNLPAEDLVRIQESVEAMTGQGRGLLRELRRQGQGRHPVAESLNKMLEMQFSAAMIYVDHGADEADGRISGGGWPNCLDDNGWGYRDFVMSDCFMAWIWDGRCAADIANNIMKDEYSYNLRYCKPYVRNCSPLIGHSRYRHRH